MSNLQVEQLTYDVDSTVLMSRLLSLPYPVFLDSCPTGTRGGRLDILAAAPLATLQVDGSGLTSSCPLPDAVQHDIFAAADHLLNTYGSGTADSSSRENGLFGGGLLGFLGYPRLAGRGRVTLTRGFLGIYSWAVTVDHLRRESWLVFHDSCPGGSRRQVRELLLKKAGKELDFNLLENFSNNMTELEYQQAFGRIKTYIDAGDCYQVNLAQRFSACFTGDPFTAYCRLRKATGKPFSAYLGWSGNALLSLSPERFIQVAGSQVTTQPIKGTRPRGRSGAEDRRLARELNASEKDRAENLMIVDLLRNDLGSICETGSVQVPQLFELQQFDNVFHLVSTVTGRLPERTSALQLLQRCFPGGSITGAPKMRAMEIIEELEPCGRDAYCGTVLYQDFNGDMDSNITIRTLLCEDETIYCWAGGGIVADSRCDQEYRECFDKIHSLINTLQE